MSSKRSPARPTIVCAFLQVPSGKDVLDEGRQEVCAVAQSRLQFGATGGPDHIQAERLQFPAEPLIEVLIVAGQEYLRRLVHAQSPRVSEAPTSCLCLVP